MLEKKKEVAKKQKKQVLETNKLREGYEVFLQSNAGQNYVAYLDTLSGEYFSRALSEPDRDKKATLVDTVAGITLARRRLVDMGTPKVDNDK